MVLVKKSAGNTGGAPSLDILAAKLRIVEAELSLEEREVKLDNGRTFMAEPNLNVKVEVVANMIIVRYGEDWFDDPRAEFEEADFEDFEFIAQVEPKTDSKGKPLTGSTINWKSIRPAGGAEEKEAKEARASAAREEEEDFDKIPS